MNMQKILIITAINGLVGIFWQILTTGFLFHSLYNFEPIEIWKPLFEFPNLIHYFWLIIIAFALTYIFNLLPKPLAESKLKQGLIFGLIVWGISALSLVSLLMFTIINLWFLLYLLINLLVIFLIQGVIISYLEDAPF